jgi:hypothetical protein
MGIIGKEKDLLKKSSSNGSSGDRSCGRWGNTVGKCTDSCSKVELKFHSYIESY